MPHTDNASIVVSGKIKVLSNKKWKQCFCVVARTAFAATVKLFIYKEASDYKKSVELSVQTPYDTIYGLDSVSNSDKSPVIAAIALTCEDRLVLLGFNNYNDLTFWVEKISDSIQDASYRAKFVKCESIGKPTQQQLSPSGATDSSGGDGRLHVQPSRLCFYSEPAESHRSLSVWPLESVNRYMVNEAMGCFVFEGDVGCGRLRGMHYFQCEKRQELYLDMKAACVNKPLPSLVHSRHAAESVANAEVDDSRRPTASSSIDIPKPRDCQHHQQPPVRPGDQESRCMHRCWHRCASHRQQEDRPLCRCACHGRAGKGAAQSGQPLPDQQQQKPRQQLGQWTADSGYSGGGSSGTPAAAYFNLHALPTGRRDYCNLPAGSAPPTVAAAGSLAFKLKSATLTAPPTNSLLAAGNQNSQRPLQPEVEAGSGSGAAGRHHRLVRSSSDLCDTGADAQLVVGTASSGGADCCSCTCCCCCNCRDLNDDGVCGSSSCGSSVGTGGASFWTAATDVRMRKPRHGFEYVSRQRVASLSSSCYANLPPPLPQFAPAAQSDCRMRLSEKPQTSAEQCQSAPAAAAGDTPLLYATLDHSSSTSPPALAGASLAAQQHRLNYTEVDHSKTSAFREIAEQLGSSRRQQQPQPPGRSNSASGSASGSSGTRLSFIRLFQRGGSFRHD